MYFHLNKRERQCVYDEWDILIRELLKNCTTHPTVWIHFYFAYRNNSDVNGAF